MGGSKIGVWLCLVVALLAGCPPEVGPAEDGQSNANPADDDNTGAQNNGGSDEPGNTGDTGEDNSSDTGDDNDGNTGADAGGNGELDAGGNGELDAGGNGELDAGGNGGLDAGTTGGVDASANSGEDAAAAQGGEDAAMSADASVPEPDAQVEEDAGPPVVVPDLGAGDMSDAERVSLIVNYLQTEAYTSSWYPVLQSEAVQRPLIVTPSHGVAVRAFQNPVAKQALDAWVEGDLPLPLDMPNGSVIVKEMYKADATQGTIADGKLIMAKIDALDSSGYEGNWFFMRITAADVAARVTTCVNCHNGRTAKGAWPINAETNPTGGSANALVPYDYLFIPYCYDSRTPECAGPN